MKEEVKRTVAYICPECRQLVIMDRSVFSLAAAPSELSCPCGKSAVKVQPLADRMELTIPCLFCGTSHRVNCSAKDFLTRKALAFSCAASGLHCCVTGEETAVFAAARRMEETADKLEEHTEEKGSFLDEIVMHEMLSELKDIAARGGVSCECGSKQWRLKVNYSSIDVICTQCGGALRIPAGCADDIDDICCKQTIQIRRGR